MRGTGSASTVRSSSVLTLALVLAVTTATAVTAAALVLTARSVVYESRQNALLDQFATDSSAALGRLPASDESDQQEWEDAADVLPGATVLISLSSGRTAGELSPDAVPRALQEPWTDSQGPVLFQRTRLDGREVFFVSRNTVGVGDDPAERIAVVTAYSLEDQRAQVQRFITVGASIIAVFLVAMIGAGTALGHLLTRPLRRLSRRAERIGDDPPDAPIRSRLREVDEVGVVLHRSAERLAETIAELRRREGQSRRLVGDVSHELRTPLASMMAVSEILDDLPNATEEERETAVRITRLGTDRLVTLVEELLELSRLDAGVARLRIRTARVSDLVRDCLVTASATGAVDVDCPEDLTVETDPTRVSKVVGNLVVNALRHGAPPVTLSARRVGSDCVITVSDAGPGVPVESSELVFERFLTLDGARARNGSTGLGLAIARESARSLGGELILQPSDAGAVFVFRFPSRIGASAL